jgi:hypothetical protein
MARGDFVLNLYFAWVAKIFFSANSRKNPAIVNGFPLPILVRAC